MDILDSLIYVGIILLILSQITEKITTFIRNYINVITNKIIRNPKRYRKSWFRLSSIKFFKGVALLDDVTDLAKSQIKLVPTTEKPKVEFAITKLSILIGFIIALLFKANLFLLITPPQKVMPHETLGWDFNSITIDFCSLFYWREFIYNFTGCAATGFLLTFGSKFFHDLLEMLYEVKRLRQKIADEYTYRSPDLATLEERLANKYDEPVKVILERHRDRLLEQFPDIISVARVFDDQGNALLEIRIEREDLSKLKSYTFDYLEGNKVKKLPESLIVLIGGAKRIQPLSDPTIWVGDRLFNNVSPGNKGTIGFFARQKGKPVLVTCYHVLKTASHPWKGLGKTSNSLNRVSVKVKEQEVNIGIISDGIINDWMDIAIVELNPNIQFDNKDSKLGEFNINLIGLSEHNSTVKINGASSGISEGTITSIENCVKIDYGTEIRKLYDLLCIKNKKKSTPLTQKGDSGSIVIDINNRIIGIVMAGIDEYTYVIPIERIKEAFNLS